MSRPLPHQRDLRYKVAIVTTDTIVYSTVTTDERPIMYFDKFLVAHYLELPILVEHPDVLAAHPSIKPVPASVAFGTLLTVH